MRDDATAEERVPLLTDCQTNTIPIGSQILHIVGKADPFAMSKAAYIKFWLLML